MRGQLLLGIMALAVALEADPLKAQAPQTAALFARDRAFDYKVSTALPVGLIDGLEELHRVQGQNAGQDSRGNSDIHLERIDVDRFSGDAHGEHPARAVEERTARRW